MSNSLPKNRPDSFLGALSASMFLQQYWQRMPLLQRGAFAEMSEWLVPEQLFDLASSDEVESRIVRRQRSEDASRSTPLQDTYALDIGPFTQTDLDALPKRDWTLLIQDLEHHIPHLHALLDWLDFLPTWRKDDVMASFAPEGGTVGPHFDQYDVFLLQVKGRRSWKLCSSFDSTSVRDDCDLQILSDFQPDQQWLVEPGDLIYLPPKVAHWGVATEDSITLSLGCRSPSLEQLLHRIVWDASEQLDESHRVTEPHPMPAGSLLRTDDLQWLAPRVNSALLEDSSALALSFARLVTEPKALFATPPEPLEAVQLRRALHARTLRHRIGSRWLRVDSRGASCLVVNGEVFRLTPSCSELASQLAAHRYLPARNFNTAEQQLVAELLKAGYLVAEHEATRY